LVITANYTQIMLSPLDQSLKVCCPEILISAAVAAAILTSEHSPPQHLSHLTLALSNGE